MNQDLKTFCTLFYQAANIPVTCFTRKGQVSFGCPGHFLFLPPMAIEKMTQILLSARPPPEDFTG